jgi:soluble P-type ATPase
MALFETIKVIDERGQEHVMTGNIFHKPLEVKQSANGVCVIKEDIFSIESETVCINRSNGFFNR